MVVFSVYLALLIRLIWFVNINSVNVLFWDQWDFLEPLFKDKINFWEVFASQHGPHRQGLGGLLTAVVYPLSGWNVRVDVFISIGVYAISCLIAMEIKRCLWGKFSWIDIVIPLAYFSLLQYETFIGTPNPAHGTVPVFLVTVSAYILTMSRQVLKVILMALLVFLTSYTGFALFSGIPIILLLVYFSLKATTFKIRVVAIVSLIMACLFFLSFFINYTNAPAADCFEFPHDKPFEYVKFISIQFGHALGIDKFPNIRIVFLVNRVFCSIIFLGLIAICCYSVYSFISYLSNKSMIIFYLSSFTLLFTFFTAVGRVCLGFETALSSRYVPYAIPGILALYFVYLELSNNPKFKLWQRYLLISAVILLFVRKEVLSTAEKQSINWYRQGKKAWVECYLKHHDIEFCNKTANFKVYPENERIVSKLKFLEKKNLNFFKDRDE